MTAVDVFDGAHAGDEAFEIAGAGGGEVVGGLETVAAGAAARHDKAGVDDGADKGDAFFDGLAILLFGVEGEAEFLIEEFRDNSEVAEELGAAGHGNDNKKVVDVATVMFVAEAESDVAVELVEENVGEELASEVADDDAAAFGLIKEAFVGGE